MIFPPCCPKHLWDGVSWASPSAGSNKAFFFRLSLLLLPRACRTCQSCWVRHSQNVLLELALRITNVCGQKERQAPHVGHGWNPDLAKLSVCMEPAPGITQTLR